MILWVILWTPKRHPLAMRSLLLVFWKKDSMERNPTVWYSTAISTRRAQKSGMEMMDLLLPVPITYRVGFFYNPAFPKLLHQLLKFKSCLIFFVKKMLFFRLCIPVCTFVMTVAIRQGNNAIPTDHGNSDFDHLEPLLQTWFWLQS